MTIPVPVRKLPADLDPRLQPHVLVVFGDTEDERDYEIEHPEACPRVCDCLPDARSWLEAGSWLHGRAWHGRLPYEGRTDCLVGWEISYAGLDCLEGDDLPVRTEGRWSDRWRLLEPGRYIIEAWCTPQGWAGSEPVYADAGLHLVGRELDHLLDVIALWQIVTRGARTGLVAGTSVLDAMGVRPEDRVDLAGGVLPKAEFPRLYEMLGTLYGPDDGDTFSLPDMRGREP